MKTMLVFKSSFERKDDPTIRSNRIVVKLTGGAPDYVPVD
jgi:hypothetical protein